MTNDKCTKLLLISTVPLTPLREIPFVDELILVMVLSESVALLIVVPTKAAPLVLFTSNPVKLIVPKLSASKIPALAVVVVI